MERLPRHCRWCFLTINIANPPLNCYFEIIKFVTNAVFPSFGNRAMTPTEPQILDALQGCSQFLPESFQTEYTRLFLPEHLQNLASRLAQFTANGPPSNHPPPTLLVECTMPLAEAFAPFASLMEQWNDLQESDRQASMAAALLHASPQALLVLLGMRWTPASVRDARALPHSREALLQAAGKIYKETLTVGARAMTKHLQRVTDQFWGEMRGGDADKNQQALTKIASLLDQATWWNVFEHYKHEIVFEARIASGYGARWQHDGPVFIGFLEPFGPEFPMVR